MGKFYTLNSKLGFRRLFVFSVLVFPLVSFAQIQGTVHDTNNQPLSFANVLLLNQKDSSLVTGVSVSDAGTFSITNFNPGKYLIKASMVGYKTTFSLPFVIKSSNDHFHVNPLIVEEDTKLLNDVDIVAKKPIYEQQIDRMVVNVEKSITSAGNTALEILEKSPGVVVNRQNKSLTLGGKEGVVIMINGKENRMPVSAAIEMLSGMSSENVKKIELITTPPSKYEAEGDAGMINIVLKKDDDFGTNGIYTLGAGMGVDGKLNGSLTLNHHVRKVNYFGMYSYSYDNSSQLISFYRQYKQDGQLHETNSESFREPVNIYRNYRIGMDYTISSKTVIGLLSSGYVSDWKMDANNNIYYKTDNQYTSLIDQRVDESNVWNHYMGNFNLEHFFKENETLEFNVDYLHYDDDNPSNYSIQYRDNANQPTSTEGIRIAKETPINTWVSKLDYVRNWGKNIKMESGLKSTATRFKNDVSVWNKTNEGDWIINTDLTNKYSLKEDISAVYTSLNFKFNEKTSMIVGLRYEYTNTVLSTEMEHGIIDRHYGKLFPTMFFSRALGKNNSVQFSYSRRITRPTFNELAPFIIFQSPDTYVTGNEKLQPSISNILKTDYKYKSVLLSFTYTNENDAIRRFQPTQSQNQDKNVLYLTSKNLNRVTTSSLMLSFPLKLAKWWNMQNNLNGLIQHVKTDYDGKYLDISLKNFRYNAINNFRITKSFNAELSGRYWSPSLWGVSKSKALYSISAGVQLKSKNEKHTFSLNLNDVFKTQIYSFSSNIPELDIYGRGRLDFEPRVLRFTYSHNFGSKKVKAERKRETGSEEERGRVTKE
jgi:hypothetical protein